MPTLQGQKPEGKKQNKTKPLKRIVKFNILVIPHCSFSGFQNLTETHNESYDAKGL